MGSTYPARIVCLTEETTETLYLLGEEARIVGISGFTVRPPRARREKPRVSAFTSAKIDRIVELKPDLVLGFSDLQADIAAELIRARHRSARVQSAQRGGDPAHDRACSAAWWVVRRRRATLIDELEAGIEAVRASAAKFARRPRVYFEEWDEPQISGIRLGVGAGRHRRRRRLFSGAGARIARARIASSPTRSKCRGAHRR